MEIKVKFIKVLDKKEGTGKDGNQWVAVQFLGETLEQYAKKIAFEVFNRQTLVDLLFSLEENAIIQVKFDVESREYNGRYYTKASVFDIIRFQSDGSAPVGSTVQQTQESASEAKKTASASIQQEETELPY